MEVEGIHGHTRLAAPREHAADALLQIGAAAVQALHEQALHRAGTLDEILHLGELARGEGVPAVGQVRLTRAPLYQYLDVGQLEAERLRRLDERELLDGSGIVAPTPAHASRLGQQLDALVVADRGRRDARPPRDLGDGQLLHSAHPLYPM